ncbi:MAG: DNA primase [Burkholderiaceae bacterium]|nr:DNA primase [Burkholderiaceae bacterium]
MAIPQSFIQDLLARADIVDVVGKHVQLKKGGANYMGLCPFHGEKSPSFSVSPTKQFYHCFGCGKNGNAIGFLMDHTGAGFVEAVQDLAQQMGLTVPEEQASAADRAQAAAKRDQHNSLGELMGKAAASYQSALKSNPRAVDYLKGRGLTGQIAKAFAMGYAPEGWRHLASVFPDYTDKGLVTCGLVITPEDDAQAEQDPANAKRYDRFRDRIMFPIRSVKGDIIGFGGRVLDKGEPKYLNSPETPLFSKGRELYGLFEGRTAMRERGYALVTEGYMDVVALAQMGFANAVATLGTACTPDHVHKLFRFTDTVVFSFDGDGAGRRAARKALEAALPYATDTRSVKFLFLPAEHDPDSFIRANGAQAFEDMVAKATPLSRFLMDAASADLDLATAEGRAHMISAAQPLWSALPDGALKRQLLSELADGCNLGAHEVLELWQANAKRYPARRTPTHGAGSSDTNGAGGNNPGGSGSGSSPGYGGDTREWRGEHNAGYGTNAPQSPVNRATNGKRAWQKKTPYASGIVGGRGHVTSRVDHVARIVLTTPQAWGWLSTEEQHLLAEQDAPFGGLFTWLEAQWHDHGPQPWAALQVAMAQQPFALQAARAVEQAETLGHEDTAETEAELRELMRRMLIEHLQRLENDAIAQADTDTSALARYRDLQARRFALQAAAKAMGDS